MLFLNENEVKRLLPISKAIYEVEEVLKQAGLGYTQNLPRERVTLNGTTLNVMSASINSLGVLGVKNYTANKKGPQAYLLLFAKNGDLLTIMEADELGRIRTGATSAIATRYLAKQNSSIATLVGTGYQANTQLEALGEIKSLKEIRIWGRDSSKAIILSKRYQRHIKKKLIPYVDLYSAVKDADVITTITSATNPILNGDWIKEGVHINAVGSNRSNARELFSNVIKKADNIFTDSIIQAKKESGDLILAEKEGISVWNKVASLSDLLINKTQGRKGNKQITIFKSNGIALQDVSVAYYVYNRAINQTIGTKFVF